ncbi:MAG: transcription antitermination factor NusB [Clostridia bacterium]|nr:transcription antitermination factor NusB [Clostridia bacterium]MDR3645566.1 transcription antitermination factor NusB [Clostridia bacterium]
MTRREAREQALGLVFEKLFSDEAIPEIIELAREARELDPDPFSEKLAVGVFEHLDEIDARIEKYSIGWNKDRLSRVVLSILRLTIYEMSYEDDIPLSVSINEAVELAKKYAGEGDAAFVNGVLGTLVRTEFEKAES